MVALCTRDGKFELSDHKDCAARGLNSAGFARHRCRRPALDHRAFQGTLTRAEDRNRNYHALTAALCRLHAIIHVDIAVRGDYHVMTDRPCRVLLVYPQFVPNSFWNYRRPASSSAPRYPAAPLGLITVAALLPQTWEFRLVNRNTEELELADLDWADLVMTGGMLPQQADTLALIELCHAHGKPVVVGGPDVTSSPHVYAAADFQVLGEAEGVIDDFVAAWERGRAHAASSRPRNSQIDVTKTPDAALRPAQVRPVPLCRRAVLARLPVHLRVLRHHRALRPRAARQDQRRRCWPSSTRSTTRLSRPCRLRRRQPDRQQEGAEGVPARTSSAWQEQHDYPFEFSTEASINLADDDELLG